MTSIDKKKNRLNHDFKTQSSYGYNFFQHVTNFVFEHHLLRKTDHIYLGISGGIDSMCLLSWAEFLKYRLGFQRITAIHINHGVHKDSEKMQLLVAKICEQKKIPLMIRYLEIGDKTHESALRDLRFEAFDEILKLIPGKLLLAHHIDDSFEWSLMQKCRSGEYASQLGIPVKRGPVIRPFMSVSRAQIETCAKKENMEFGHDPTNSLMSIDRNYLRTHVTNNLFRRYPKSIKNYVLASNQLAQKLGLHILPKPIELNHENLKIKQWPQETIIYHPQNLAIKNISQELLKAEIYRLSTKERGKIAGQMINLIRAIKSHKLGPISFSGGVKVYLRPNCLRIVAKNYQLKDTHIPKGEPLQNDYQQFARLFLQKNRWCSVKTLCVKEGDLSKLPKIVKNLPLKPKAESDSSDKMHGFCLVDSYSFLYYWQKLASQKNMHIYL